jgi:hypothetical protein
VYTKYNILHFFFVQLRQTFGLEANTPIDIVIHQGGNNDLLYMEQGGAPQLEADTTEDEIVSEIFGAMEQSKVHAKAANYLYIGLGFIESIDVDQLEENRPVLQSTKHRLIYRLIMEALRRQSVPEEENDFSETVLCFLLPVYSHDMWDKTANHVIFGAMPMILRDLYNIFALAANLVATHRFTQLVAPLWPGVACVGAFHWESMYGRHGNAVHPTQPHRHFMETCPGEQNDGVFWNFDVVEFPGHAVFNMPPVASNNWTDYIVARRAEAKRKTE